MSEEIEYGSSLVKLTIKEAVKSILDEVISKFLDEIEKDPTKCEGQTSITTLMRVTKNIKDRIDSV